MSLQYYYGLFPDLYDNAPVKADGATAWHTPPHSYARRLRHSGRVVLSLKSPPFIGMNFIKKGIHLESKEARKVRETDIAVLHTRRKMVVYQWFPMKTELITESCVTAFHHSKYDGSIYKCEFLVMAHEPCI